MKSFAALRTKMLALKLDGRLALAAKAGVPAGIAMLAASRIVNAEAFLSLCHATGIDPVTGEAREIIIRPIIIDWQQFALAVRMRRAYPWTDIRTAAKRAKVSMATFSRAANGHPLSIGSMLKLCAYAGVHPDLYAQPRPTGQEAYHTALTAGRRVSRKTVGKLLKEKENERATG